jgi:hypothetical protein
MRRLAGQAAHGMARLLRRAAGIALTLVVVACVAVALLGWRLSHEPLAVPWLARGIERSVNADAGGNRLVIADAALAWEGFRSGVDRPLDLRLGGIALTDPAGARLMAVPRAEVSLSLLGLLFGRIEPRGIEIDHASIQVYRSAAGAISLNLGNAAETPHPAAPDKPTGVAVQPGLLAEFSHPAGSDHSLEHSHFRQLRRVRIEDASIVVVDRQLGATWRAPDAVIDLTRGANGGVAGHAELTLSLGDQTTHLSAEAALAPGGASTRVRAGFTPIAPAALARAAPMLAAPILATPILATLAAADLPVGGTLALTLGPTLNLVDGRLTARLGAGSLRLGATTVAVLDGSLVAAGNGQAVSLEAARLAFRGHDGGPVSVLSATGRLQRDPDRLRARLAVGLDRLAFADLAHVWPAGLNYGARDWVVGNITAGTAHDGHLEVQLDAQPDLSDITLSGLRGTLDGDGLTVWWLRPIQPIDHGIAQLRILDPDTLEIAVRAGRQRPEGARPGDTGTGTATDTGTGTGTGTASDGLAIRDGSVRITGMMRHEQDAAIHADIDGSMTDILALLRTPRLHLLDHQPVDLRAVGGQAAVKLSIGLPLDADVKMDAIAIGAQAHLVGVHAPGLVAGRDLTDGVLDLTVDDDGLTLAGQAALAAIPATFKATMDFRAGPPSQVLQTVSLTAAPSAAQLAGAGMDPSGVIAGGTAAITATLTERRDGQGRIAAAADLADAALRLDLAGWTKPAGPPAHAEAVIRLNHDRLVGIERMALTGGGATIAGHASFADAGVADGGDSVLRIDRLSLGRTTATGSVRFPQAPDAPIVASVSGDTIDLSARLSYRAPKTDETETDRVSVARPAARAGPPWTLDAHFDHAIMANAQTFDALALHAEDNGTKLTALRLTARAAAGAPILVAIVPDRGGRQFTATAADAGGLLRALDVVRTMDGGQLSISGSFADDLPNQPLSGTARIEDFRIRNAPAMARLLQAMTLYGLVDSISGPGLGFSRLIAPFRLSGPVLDLREARAFNASLGLTAKGSIDLAADHADVNGTIVPAYFFNTLLGRIPLVGRLFSPEQGGGLFAANYALRGALSDPVVTVNPLSALTPGFLRGLFDGF